MKRWMICSSAQDACTILYRTRNGEWSGSPLQAETFEYRESPDAYRAMLIALDERACFWGIIDHAKAGAS